MIRINNKKCIFPKMIFVHFVQDLAKIFITHGDQSLRLVPIGYLGLSKSRNVLYSEIQIGTYHSDAYLWPSDCFLTGCDGSPVDGL